jgi:hypothetical protein
MRKYTDAQLLAEALRGALMAKRERELAKAAGKRRTAGQLLAKSKAIDISKPPLLLTPEAMRPQWTYNIPADVASAVEALKIVRGLQVAPPMVSALPKPARI